MAAYSFEFDPSSETSPPGKIRGRIPRELFFWNRRATGLLTISEMTEEERRTAHEAVLAARKPITHPGVAAIYRNMAPAPRNRQDRREVLDRIKEEGVWQSEVHVEHQLRHHPERENDNLHMVFLAGSMSVVSAGNNLRAVALASAKEAGRRISLGESPTASPAVRVLDCLAYTAQEMFPQVERVIDTTLMANFSLHDTRPVFRAYVTASLVKAGEA